MSQLTIEQFKTHIKNIIKEEAQSKYESKWIKMCEDNEYELREEAGKNGITNEQVDNIKSKLNDEIYSELIK